MNIPFNRPLFCLTCSCLFGSAAFIKAADHREAPLIQEDGSADIADLYAFRSPSDSNKLVLAMTVNPMSAPPENATYHFSPDVLYRFQIDTDGDARADKRVEVTFSDPAAGAQTFQVSLPGGRSFSGEVTAGSAEPNAPSPKISNGQGATAFAGQRDDPFFFDVVGFQRFLAGTGSFSGTDGFAGYNVSAIVIELPISEVSEGSDDLQIWAETRRKSITVRGDVGVFFLDNMDAAARQDLANTSSVGVFERIERMGNPAINTALVPLGMKDRFNRGAPSSDAADFAGALVASLQSLGTNEENIGILAGVAVPDTIKLNLGTPDGYPNGRAPSDDVIDTLFFFIFNQTEVPDGVDGNDRSFSNNFPYLASPHQPN